MARRGVSRSVPRVVLVIGGVRSGKSVLAENFTKRFASEDGVGVTYVATWRGDLAGSGGDSEMQRRVAVHKARRPTSWETVTVDATTTLTQALRAAGERVALVDSLGTWLAADPPVDDLLDTIRRRAGRTVLVSDEVGLGLLGGDAPTRSFQDRIGRLHSELGEIAEAVVFCVAGRAMVLRSHEAILDELTGP